MQTSTNGNRGSLSEGQPSMGRRGPNSRRMHATNGPLPAQLKSPLHSVAESRVSLLGLGLEGRFGEELVFSSIGSRAKTAM